jgi:hypothetical protein
MFFRVSTNGISPATYLTATLGTGAAGTIINVNSTAGFAPSGVLRISNPGGILVLEIPPRNYSMYEIARICENEDVIILAMHSRTNERGMLEITMKLNRTVLDAVVASFERHNYHAVEVFGRETNKEDILSKYNLLMNYINM